MRFIPSEELQSGTVVGRDIVFTARKTAALKKGTVLTDRYIEYLQEKGYLGAYVTDELSYDIELEEAVDQGLFQDGVEAVMEENIAEMLDVGNDIVSDIISKKEICTDLIDLRSFDDYTYHHSVNVAVLAVLVAREMGLSEAELRYICQAGLLHDLGKSRIPEEVLNKPDRLTDEEYKTIQMHAQFSYDMISGSFEVSSVVKNAVLCHHENENGSGYPNGREGDEISVLAKIIHAVDVYDALTSKRPYKEPYEPANAFEYMRGGSGSQFNGKVIEALISVIPPYPAGVDVYLSNGERAVVVNHSLNSMRPVIRLVSNGQTIDLATDEEYKDIKILRSGIIPIGIEEGEIHQEEKIKDLNESRSAVKLVKKKVFLIDSNKANRMQVENIIESESHLKSFESSLDALTHVRGGNVPDLVIIDVNMPVIDGIATVEKMRAAAGKQIPVIFITAVNKAETIIKCRQMGKSDYILKPANPLYIKERIFNALYNIEA